MIAYFHYHPVPGRLIVTGFNAWLTSYRSKTMFEHHQDLLAEMIKKDEDFRRNYNRHQEIDKRVTAAELGTAPMEDLALNQLKKEKLWLKDKLAVFMNAAQA